MKRKHYEQELRSLQAQLCELQDWVRDTGQRIIVVFEGRDAAGKGGCIRALTERVSPRVFRVVALPKPSDREKSQIYLQRYISHFPAGGEIVVFDRSWYNRAGVERVMGFCSEDESRQFLKDCPNFERSMIVDNDVIFLKYWLEVSEETQEKRFRDRINDPIKQWKLSEMDLPSRERWYQYSRARDDMLDATDTEFAPWYVVDADDKRNARLSVIRHLLSCVPYESRSRHPVALPQRDESQAYDDAASMRYRRWIDSYEG